MDIRPADNVGRVLNDRYRLVAPVGVGASAIVYQAEDVHLRRTVAVKLLHPQLAGDQSFVERFLAEAQTAASLNHRNLVAVHDWGFDGGPFMVTEFLGGGTLRTIINAGHRLSPSQCLIVGLQIANGLEYAHARGVVHRDIKPSNILFDESGNLRIGDFGLARALAQTAITEPEGVAVGTARYAAPEQAQALRVDARADVYALSIVLGEAASGEVSGLADTPVGTLAWRATNPVTPAAELQMLGSILETAGRPDPNERPSAGELAAGLVAAAGKLPRPEPLPLVAISPVVEHPAHPTTHRSADHVEGLAPVVPLGVVPAAQAPTFAPREEEDVRAEDLVPEDDEVSHEATVRLDRNTTRSNRPPLVKGVSPRAAANPPQEAPSIFLMVLGALAVAALLGGGWLAFGRSNTPEHTVPEVVGVDVSSLPVLVDDFGWNVVRLEDRVPGIRPGDIVAQSPGPGSKLSEGGDFRVTVAIGDPLVLIPDVQGLNELEMAAQLRLSGLTQGELTYEASEDVPAGVVIRSDSIARQVSVGSEVPIVISNGPVPRELPVGMVGAPLEEVEQALLDSRMVPVVVTQYDFEVPEGTIISTDPAEGTADVPVGSEVQVIVSAGAQTAVVPELEDFSVEDATDALNELGLCVGELDGSPDTEVLATDPPAGDEARLDECIRVITRLNE